LSKHQLADFPEMRWKDISNSGDKNNCEISSRNRAEINLALSNVTWPAWLWGAYYSKSVTLTDDCQKYK